MVRFSTLGMPRLDRGSDGHRVHLCAQPKPLALLAYLALESVDHAPRRDRIVYLLWPELDQGHARAALSQTLYRLRQQIGHGAVVTFGQEQVAVSADHVSCDAVELEAALAAGRDEDATRLYTGEFLDGVHLGAAPDFEQWLSERRTRFRRGVVAAALRVASAAEAQKDLRRAIHVLHRALATSPLEESVVMHLVRLLDRAGDSAEAVRVHDAYADRLRAEYDLVPSARLRDTIGALRGRASSRPSTTTSTNVSAIRSVAVLSFRMIGERAGATAFDVGLQEEIVSALSQIDTLAVIGRGSSFRFTSGEHEPREVGARLGVDALLEGTVHLVGSHARIHTRLVRARDGVVLWSRGFSRERSVRALFAVQEEIARAIVNALRIELNPSVSRRLTWRPTTDLDAYSLCLQGRHAWSRRSPAELASAQRLFRRSIRRDPAYAAAWSGLADTLTLLPLYAPVDTPTTRRRARAAAVRAVELDDGSAEAHAALARSLDAELHWNASATEYRRALELDPSYATAHHWYANHLLRLGNPDGAVREIEQAVRLDPLSPAVRAGHAFILYLLRRYAGAIRSAERAIAMEGSAEGPRLVLAMARAESGRPREAVEICAAVRQALPGASRVPGALAYALARAGEVERAYAVLRDARGSAAEPLMLAAAYAALGEPDATFRQLTRADWGTINVDMVARSAAFDSVRSDARYRALEARLGLSSRRNTRPT